MLVVKLDQRRCQRLRQPLLIAVGRPSALAEEHAIDLAARVHPQDVAGFVEADALPGPAGVEEAAQVLLLHLVAGARELFLDLAERGREAGDRAQ
ncbi:hypothetical protein [Reyranella sp.]|uniref:hypothetical protein n=1 Tax=Reyranella sp. TaxID=1929291 RepID=UPI0027215A0B|nr:hypothetical protein [Reyranella sp.]MDO8973131.1 hypothetical protein [Reyranella sp.]